MTRNDFHTAGPSLRWIACFSFLATSVGCSCPMGEGESGGDVEAHERVLAVMNDAGVPPFASLVAVPEQVTAVDTELMRGVSGYELFVEIYDSRKREKNFPCRGASMERRSRRRHNPQIDFGSRLRGSSGRDLLVVSSLHDVAALGRDDRQTGVLNVLWGINSHHGPGYAQGGPNRLYMSAMGRDEFFVVSMGEDDVPLAAVVCPGPFIAKFSNVSSVGGVHRFAMKPQAGPRFTVEVEISAWYPTAVTLRPLIQRLDGTVAVRDDGNDLANFDGNLEHFVWRRTMTDEGLRYVPFSKAPRFDIVWDLDDRGYIIYSETRRKGIIEKLGIVGIEVGPDGFAPPPRYRELPSKHHVTDELTLMRFGGGAPEPVAFASNGAAILRLGGLDGPATLYRSNAPLDYGAYTKRFGIDPVVADLDGDGTDELYLFWILFHPPLNDAKPVARGQPPRSSGDYDRSVIIQVSIEGEHAVAREMKVNWSKPTQTYVIRYDDDVEYKPILEEASEVG